MLVFITTVTSTGFDRHACSSRSIRNDKTAFFTRTTDCYNTTRKRCMYHNPTPFSLVGICFSLQSYCAVRTESTALLMASVWNDSLHKSQILGIPSNALPFACLIAHNAQLFNARKIKFPTRETKCSFNIREEKSIQQTK